MEAHSTGSFLIRQATNGDVPRIVELGMRDFEEGPYKNLINANSEYAIKTVLAVIHGGGKILLCEDQEKVSGLFAFLIMPHPFSGEIVATQLIFYVEPEARKGGTGIKLLWEAERVAKELGAKKFQCTAPSEEVGAIYRRFGYHQIEVAFLKELT